MRTAGQDRWQWHLSLRYRARMPKSLSPPPPSATGGESSSLAAATLALFSAGPLVQGALLLLAAGLVLWLARTVLQPKPEKRLVIATSPEQGA